MPIEDRLEISDSTSVESILKQVNNSSSTKKQEQALEKLLTSEKLFTKFIKQSPECEEIFAQLGETMEALDALKSSSTSLNLNETNVDFLFAVLEKSIKFHKSNITSLEESTNKFDAGTDKNDVKATLNKICSTLLSKYINLITKCILMKSSTKKTVELQETCVRLLTLCVNQSVTFAKQIALEYDHFNNFKNWLERFLLLKQTYLRELCVEFLISFLKYAKVYNTSTPVANEETLAQSFEDRESLFFIKKIFLNTNNPETETKNQNNQKNKSIKPSATTHSSLLYCLFSNLNTDSRESIEFLLQELLFRFVQNDSFSKSEKLKFFNEKTLTYLTKLFEWSDTSVKAREKLQELELDGDAIEENQTLVVRKMITEFLKILFCSTRYGINFYDRTLNIDQSTKNFNHLIFSVIINIQRPALQVISKKGTASNQLNDVSVKTNDMIDELLLKTLKVCPDLIQRFLKVKYKKESNKDVAKQNLNDLNEEWFIRFCTRLFEQQHSIIKNMQKNVSNTTSFLRSISANDNFNSSELTTKSAEDLKTFLCELIIQTSFPLCLSFQKLLTVTPTMSISDKDHFNKSLKLIIISLKCVQEWKKCLIAMIEEQMNRSNEENLESEHSKYLIFANLKKILFDKNENVSDKFFFRLNLELLNKYLPKFSLLFDCKTFEMASSIDSNSNESYLALIRSFEIFSLYFDIFVTKQIQKFDISHNESQDLMNNCFNILEIDSLEKNLKKILPKLLLNSASNESNSIELTMCCKYLKFLTKYLSLKDNEQYFDDKTTSSDFDDQNLIDLNLKVLSSKENKSELNYSMSYKNTNIHNLVRIIYKFRTGNSFERLAGYFMTLIEVCLNENTNNFKETDSVEDLGDNYEIYLNNQVNEKKFNYDKDYIFLWLNLVKKHMENFRIDTPNSEDIKFESTLFLDFIYICLYNLTNSKQRNLILFQMSLSSNNEESQNNLNSGGFNMLLVFICLKTLVNFHQNFSSTQLKVISDFFLDYVFNSSLIVIDPNSNGSIQLTNLFSSYFSNDLLLKGCSNDKAAKSIIEKMSIELNEKLNECNKLASSNEKVKLSNGTKFRINTLSQAFMHTFEKSLNFKTLLLENDHSIRMAYLNLTLRVRHLIYLMSVLNKEEMKEGLELKLILDNLENCLLKSNELSHLCNSPSIESKSNEINLTNEESYENKECNEDFCFKMYQDHVLKLIFNNSILIEGAFFNVKLTTFLNCAWSILIESQSNNQQIKKYSQIFLHKFLWLLKNSVNEISDEQVLLLSKPNLDLISNLLLKKLSFFKLVDYMFNSYMSYLEKETKIKLKGEGDDENFNKFSFFTRILQKNQHYLFENDMKMSDELNALSDKHVDSILNLTKMISLVLFYMAKLDLDQTFSSESNEISTFLKEKKEFLIEFLEKCFKYSPLLFKILVRNVCISVEVKLKLPKFLKKNSSQNQNLFEIFEFALRDEKTFNFLDKNVDDENKAMTVSLTNNVEQLLSNYSHTMSERDRLILNKLYKLDSSLNVLMFKLNENTNSKGSIEILNKQAKIADFIALKLDEHKLSNTIQNFPISRKLADINQEQLESNDDATKIYDPIYLLPNIFNLLNFANIVDVLKFVQSRCLSFLFASLSIECDKLRSLAYSSLHLFVSHLENSHAYFKSIVLYLINLLRSSLEKENQRLPSIISVFLAESVMVIIEPGTTLYKPIVQFLLLKPTLDLTNVPEFYKLFNSSSIQFKTERKWILNILSYSCRTSLDYRIFEKRFIYRQLLAIYTSKLGEYDIKLSVLNLIYKTCKCKFALIDLIRKHYLLIWMSGVLESSHVSQNENDLNIFYKLLQIFNLIWSQLGENSGQHDRKQPNVQNMTPPITFLNQMYVLMNMFVNKLTSLQAIEHQLEYITENSMVQKATSHIQNKNSIKINELECFFLVKNKLVQAIKKFEFNLAQFENEENLNKQFESILNENLEKIEISKIIELIESRKRKSQDKTQNFPLTKHLKRE